MFPSPPGRYRHVCRFDLLERADIYIKQSHSTAKHFINGKLEFVPSSVHIVGQIPEILKKVSEAQIQVPLACNAYFTDEQISDHLHWDFTSKSFLSSRALIGQLSLDHSIWVLHTAIHTFAQRYKSQYEQMTDWVLGNLGPTMTERQSIQAGQEKFEEDMDRWKTYMSEMMMVLMTEKDVDRDTAVSVVSELVEQKGVRGGVERVQICQVEETAWI